MEILFSALAVFLLAQSFGALLAAVRLARYIRRMLSLPRDRYVPKTAVIIPCKGLDPDFEENIAGYLAQDYRHYELLFVTESENDPAHRVIKRVLQESERSAWLLTAGEAQKCGQKVHNLCVALDTLDALDRKTEVLVYADADARPEANWLQELVGPLSDRRIGATTGFRWYLARSANFWSHLLSVWNASALNLLGERSAFAWGGAMAINRDLFESLRIKQRWEAGAVSDDYILTSAIHAEGLRIKFVPQCLMVSEATPGLRQLLEFTTRQLTITRVYAPRVWWLALTTNTLFNFTFWGSLIAWAGGLLNAGIAIPCVLLSYLFGSVTGGLRGLVATSLFSEADKPAAQKGLWAHMLLHPIASLLYFYNLVNSARTRKIVWRGIGYEMLSPTETIISPRPEISVIKELSEAAPQQKGAAARTTSSLDS